MPTSTSSHAKYRYLIFLGNNSDLVRQTLRRRPWWTSAIEDEDADGNVCVHTHTHAHIHGHTIFGGSSGLTPLPRYDFARHKALAEDAFIGGRFDFCWKPVLGIRLPSTGECVTVHTLCGEGRAHTHAAAAARRQMVNHFPSVKCIASKAGLLRSLQRYYSRVGLEVFDHVPTTFVLQDVTRSGAPAYQRFCAWFRALASGDASAVGERMPAKCCLRNMWLVKPSYLNQGKGIKVHDSLGAIKEHLLSVDRVGLAVDGATVSAGAEWVVQKYVERPLLLNGRKFDIRIWVAVTDTFDIYVYQDGYCRTSSEQFTLDVGKRAAGGGARDHATFVHLTNYCMQKHSTRVGTFELGNTLSFEQLQTYLDMTFGAGHIDLRAQIFPRMKELILDAVLANRDDLPDGGRGRRCFELFGYDFLLDEDFRCWLIEVNTNPYIDKQNPWHHRLLQRMMEDLVTLTLDKAFPAPDGAMAAPLPDECYTQAFAYRLRWQPIASRAGDGVVPADGSGEAEPDRRTEDDAKDGPEVVASKADRAAGSGRTPRALSRPSSRPARSALSPYRSSKHTGVHYEETGDSEHQEDYSGIMHYRDPRTNGWELLYSEDPGIKVLDIAHQAAMAEESVNKVIVERAAMSRSPPSVDDLATWGMPLVTRFTSDDPSAEPEPSAPGSLGPFTRRYIRRRDAAWLYPLGPPAETDPTGAAVDACAPAGASRSAGARSFSKPVAIARQRVPKVIRNVGHVLAPVSFSDTKSDDSDTSEAGEERAASAAQPRQRIAPRPTLRMDAAGPARNEDAKVEREDAAPTRNGRSALASTGARIVTDAPRKHAAILATLSRIPATPLATSTPTTASAALARVRSADPGGLRSFVQSRAAPSAAADAYVGVSLLKPVERACWAVTQLRYLAHRCGRDVHAWTADGTRCVLPAIAVGAPFNHESADASPVFEPHTPCASAVTLSAQRRLLCASLRYLHAAASDREALPQACAEGLLPTLFTWMCASASGGQDGAVAEIEESDDKPATDTATEPPEAMTSNDKFARLLTERSRTLLFDLASALLPALKRNQRLRRMAVLPHPMELLDTAAPRALCPWLPRDPRSDASDMDGLLAKFAAASSLRGDPIAALQAAWILAASRVPVVVLLQIVSLRLLAFVLAASASANKPTPSTTDRIDPTDADIDTTTAAAAPYIRSQLLNAGLASAVALQTLISSQESRRTARDLISCVSVSELRGALKREEQVLFRDGEPAARGRIALKTLDPHELSATALTRELAVRMLAQKRERAHSGATAPDSAAAVLATASDSEIAGNSFDISRRTPLYAMAARSTARSQLGQRGPRPEVETENDSSDEDAGQQRQHVRPQAHVDEREHHDNINIADDQVSNILGSRTPVSRRGRGTSGYTSEPPADYIAELRKRVRAFRRAQKARNADNGPHDARGIVPRPAARQTQPPLLEKPSDMPGDPVDDSGDTDPAERAAQLEVAHEEWRKRKDEAAREKREREEAEKAAHEAGKQARERERAERFAAARRKLVEARAREAARTADRLRSMTLRAREEQLAAARREELYKQREAGWVGISSAIRTTTDAAGLRKIGAGLMLTIAPRRSSRSPDDGSRDDGPSRSLSPSEMDARPAVSTHMAPPPSPMRV